MSSFNLNNKSFALLQNSEKGEVDSDTIFKYQQEAKLVTAEYCGWCIKYGKLEKWLVTS